MQAPGPPQPDHGVPRAAAAKTKHQTCVNVPLQEMQALCSVAEGEPKDGTSWCGGRGKRRIKNRTKIKEEEERREGEGGEEEG